MARYKAQLSVGVYIILTYSLALYWTLEKNEIRAISIKRARCGFRVVLSSGEVLTRWRTNVPFYPLPVRLPYCTVAQDQLLDHRQLWQEVLSGSGAYTVVLEGYSKSIQH